MLEFKHSNKKLFIFIFRESTAIPQSQIGFIDFIGNILYKLELMNRFLYAVRPTLDILGDTIAILLDRELTQNKFHRWLSIRGIYFIAG